MTKHLTKTAVIVVDVQSDFTVLKNGSLAVDGTDETYIKAVQETTRRLRETGLPVYATQDWHPADHISFFTNHPGKKSFDVIKLRGKDQVLWPPHCVQNTSGAQILLDKELFKAIVRKGMDPRYDSYSGFQDDGGKKTNMDKLLKEDNIQKVVVYGIATDYCVRATALDALAAGYNVITIESLCRGVAPDTSEKAMEEMKARGIVLMEYLDLEKSKTD